MMAYPLLLPIVPVPTLIPLPEPININTTASDPFANQRTEGDDPFAQDKLKDVSGPDSMRLDSASPPSNRRTSREWGMSIKSCTQTLPLIIRHVIHQVKSMRDWSSSAYIRIHAANQAPNQTLTCFTPDASKVPPSQFQKRKGSIYSVPASRDGHVRGKDAAYHAKLKEKVRD